LHSVPAASAQALSVGGLDAGQPRGLMPPSPEVAVVDAPQPAAVSDAMVADAMSVTIVAIRMRRA
jgi:hypothetical protein